LSDEQRVLRWRVFFHDAWGRTPVAVNGGYFAVTAKAVGGFVRHRDVQRRRVDRELPGRRADRVEVTAPVAEGEALKRDSEVGLEAGLTDALSEQGADRSLGRLTSNPAATATERVAQAS
jgi:hypothetical protein